MPGLKLQIWKGERFKIGEVFCSIVATRGSRDFTLEVEKGMNERFEVKEGQWVEVMPAVKVTSGVSTRANRAVVVIDAPKTMRIERMQHEPEKRFVAQV